MTNAKPAGLGRRVRPTVCVSCPGSWPELREAGRGFAATGQLVDYYTTTDPDKNRILAALAHLPGPAGRYVGEQSRRRALGAITSVARERGSGWDLVAAVVNRASGKSRLHGRVLEQRDRRFDRAVSRDLQGDAEMLIGQAGGCLHSIRAAQRLGMRTVVNWNIQHWEMGRAEQALERAQNPAWAPLFTFGRFPPRMIRVWERELGLADAVLTPSSAVVESFVRAGYADRRFVVVPYGVDAERFQPPGGGRRYDGRLRVICVGEIGQRKGISYFFEVARQLPGIDFHAAGWHVGRLPEAPPVNVTVSTNVPDIVPALQQAHVFLFPSLLDGFGLVVLQAMACGLPVICSANAGGRDIVMEGRNGWVVPARDVEMTAERLRQLDRDRSALVKAASSARETALARPWERFHRELADVVSRTCASG